MAPKSRRAGTSLTAEYSLAKPREVPIADVFRQTPQTFEFFQAVRVLERLQPGRRAIGYFVPPKQEVVRIGAHASMSFPASYIQNAIWKEDAAPFLLVNFMGMTGPMGVLPHYYTTLVMDRLRAKDRVLSEFLDVFNHRMVSLFYRAWEKYHYGIAYERGGMDPFSRNLLDLVGLGTKGLQQRLGVRDETVIFYAGLMAQKPRSAVGLEQLLADYFDVPVRVQQFVGAWYKIDSGTQCQLEDWGYDVSRQLGFGALVGDEVYSHQSKIRVRMGPLTLAQYKDFLPDGAAYAPLKSLVRFWAGDWMEYEVQLILDRASVPACHLGGDAAEPPRLGWLSWVKNQTQSSDPDETILRL
ncbi:MAG: type VI secretion system baseplate subunit TssG [Bryobacterales bacterium]|jgi:type VI secretion system protein ImpH|nr:type VI secretion system baseplate subunit TssG [Bryobacterales bacterium]